MLEVVDDGVGFDSSAVAGPGTDAARGYGLSSIAERTELVGGQLQVRSRPGEGTTVTVTVPLRTPLDRPG